MPHRYTKLNLKIKNTLVHTFACVCDTPRTRKM